MGMIMQIYFQCYFGNQLVYKSNQLTVKAFHSNWIEQDQQFKRFLLIFDVGAQNPIIFFAGGLFKLDLATFLRVSRGHDH